MAASEATVDVNLGLVTRIASTDPHETTETINEKTPTATNRREYSKPDDNLEAQYSSDGTAVGTGPEDGDDHTPSEDPDDVPPDGGRAAWLCILGAWCASTASYGWINSLGTFQEYYQSGPLSSYTPSQISWITSLQVFFMSALGPFTGQIYDRYGITWLMRVGSFMHVFGLMMASLSTQYYQFLLSQGVCSSIGVAMVFVCAMSTIPDWFLRRRGLAFGVFATGSSLGGVIFPIMVSNLIREVGYGWAMRSVAFLILVLVIVCNCTVRMRRPPRPVKLTRKALAKPFTELTFVLLAIGLFLMPFGMYVPITYMPSAGLGQGIVSKEWASNLVALYNAGSLFGRLGSGWISDRLGKYNIFICSGVLSGILILALWIPASNAAATITFAPLFGLFSGAYISLMGALTPAISPMEEIGYRNGIMFLCSAIGGLITSPIAGMILETPAGWTGLKLFAGVFLIAGAIGVMAARVSRAGWKLNAIF